MAWTNLLNALFLPGKPILGSTGVALRDNLVSACNGDAGAPRILGGAVARPGTGGGLPVLTVAAADTYEVKNACGIVSTTVTFGSTNSTSSIVMTRHDILSYSGSLRFKANLVATGSGTSYLELFRNGTLVSSFSTGSAGTTARSADCTVAPGDYIEWRCRNATAASTSACSNPAVWGSDAYVENLPLVRASLKTG